MTKPTLLQTIFNRPSQSYAFPRDNSSQPHQRHTARVATNLGRLASPFKLDPTSISAGYFSADQKASTGVHDNLSSIEAQDSSTHVSSSSRASHSDPSTLSAATSLVPSHSSPSHSPHPKDSTVSDPSLRLDTLRNTVSNPDNVSQPGHVHLGALPPNHSRTEDNDEEDEDEEEDSIEDVFYTPNSSPRASFTSPASMPMSYATTMPPPQPPRESSRRSLLDKTSVPERSPSHRSVNRNAETTPNESTSHSWKTKTNNNATTSKGHFGGITSKELPPPASILPPPPASTRIAVPSTRTSSRSNSLNRSRQNLGSRSGLSSAATLFAGQGQRKVPAQAHDRTMATVSIASATSSMSSNTLNGHSVVFSDLTTEATNATTPPIGVSGTSNSSKEQYESTRPGAPRKSSIDQGHTATRTHKDSSPIPTSPSKPKSSKSHTYSGLNVNGSPSPSGPRSNAPISGSTTTYYQYQRGRDMKHSGPMLSMTAVLEAAEEEELLRYGMKRVGGGGGPSTSKTRGVLKEHSTKKNYISGSGSGAGVGGAAASATTGISSNSKGKGKERARHDPLESERDLNGKDTGRKRDYSTHHKHSPHTSSPLAMSTSSKPLPTPASVSSLPRNNGFLDVSMSNHPRLGHQRSRSLGAESKPRIKQYPEPPASSSRSHIQMDLMRSRSRSPGHSISDSRTSSSATNVNNGIVDLTALPKSSGELPSNGVAGHSSLVLPRAPPPLNLVSNGNNRNGPLNGGGGGKIDLTRDGLAQTTMASVEVVRGLGSTTGKKGLMAMLQSRRKTKTASGGGRREDVEYSGGKGNVLGFTNYRRPPDYVPSESILVQVWAVGVDGIDGRLIGVKMVNVDGAGAPLESQGAGRSEESLDESRGRHEDTAEGSEAKNKQAKKSGLGRGLSLRERLQRSVSIGRAVGKEFLKQQRQEQLFQKQQQQQQSTSNSSSQLPQEKNASSNSGSGMVIPGIGFIPGRSFVGRVVECGWEVREDVFRKGDWVAGLLNIKKCGGLTEFIVVDRHRVHRVPHPKLSNRDTYTDAPSSLVFSSPPASPTSSVPMPHYSLTLEELALLPLCGVPAYRAVRTFTYAFSSMRDNLSSGSIKRTPSERTQHGHIRTDFHGHYNSAIHGGKIPHLNPIDHENGRRRRALVLRGHDGIGAMALQILVHRGWRVCVHVPFIASPPNAPTTPAVADKFMEEVEERIRNWGAEEVIFDDGEVLGTDEGRAAIVRVIDGLTEDGDAFDVVLDTVGGKEVREAAEKLLRSPGRRIGIDGNDVGRSKTGKSGVRGMGQFTTIVGDNPERVIPSAGDMFRAGLRSLKFSTGSGGTTTPSTDKGFSENVHLRNTDNKGSKVGYAWINISQDLDYEGKDIGDTIGSLVELALEYGIKPWVGAEHASVKGVVGEDKEEMRSREADIAASSGFGHWEGRRIVSFEKAPDIFVDSGPLNSGGTVVIKIAA